MNKFIIDGRFTVFMNIQYTVYMNMQYTDNYHIIIHIIIVFLSVPLQYTVEPIKSQYSLLTVSSYRNSENTNGCI